MKIADEINPKNWNTDYSRCI